MSTSEDEPTTHLGITDDQLPDDLVPSDDNPLAEGLDDGETVDGLLTEGKTPDQDDDEDEETATGSGAPDA